jgi:hypothetical protein
MSDDYQKIISLTKKKYYQFQNTLLNEFNNDDVDKILSYFKTIMKFDPEKTTYTKELGKKIIEKRREKSKETGISTYILCGGKKNYEKNKTT